MISESSPETVEVKLLLSGENVGFGTRILEDPYRIVVDLYPAGSVVAQKRRNKKDRRAEDSGAGKVSQVREEKKAVIKSMGKSTAGGAELKKVSAEGKEQEKVVVAKKSIKEKKDSSSELKKNKPDELAKVTGASASRAKKKKGVCERGES